MAKIQHTGNTNFWQGCEAIRTPIHCWWECKMVATLEDSLVVSYKSKHTLATHSSNDAP